MATKELFGRVGAVARPAVPRRHNPGPWVRRSLIFITCALALNALIGERGLAETLRARQQLRHADTELHAIKNRNAGLSHLIDALQRDLGAIEHIARDELGLIRKGEVLVLVKDVPAR
jgi:cell division protein FtsB